MLSGSNTSPLLNFDNNHCDVVLKLCAATKFPQGIIDDCQHLFCSGRAIVSDDLLESVLAKHFTLIVTHFQITNLFSCKMWSQFYKIRFFFKPKLPCFYSVRITPYPSKEGDVLRIITFPNQ